MKKIYILVLFFAFNSQFIHSQYSASSNYFPLQIGNKWTYERFQTPSATTSYLQVSITKDTLVNSKRYYFIHHFPELGDYWVGYDTAVGILYYFYGTEAPYIKLSANIGDTTNYICSAIVDTSFFNTSTRLKKYYKEYHVPHSSSGTEIQLAKNFGQTYYFEYSASFTTSNYLYAWLRGCIINGILYGDTSLTGGTIQTPPEIPTEYLLYQNYPNPFNPSTKISFNIPLGGFVSLKVYNSAGAEIESIINSSLEAGPYTYQWIASDFPSGIYFYKIQAGELSETKKMVLIK